MDEAVKVKLEAGGFRQTTVEELLGLTPAESQLIETRLALARLIKELRQQRHVTQRDLAELLGSDQANVSKAEKNDANVSLEWMLKAAYALGADRKQVGQALCG